MPVWPTSVKEIEEAMIEGSLNRWRYISGPNQMFYSATRRAKRDGLVFDIDVNDLIIPTRCPVFGTLFLPRKKQCDESATVDRINPLLGYIKGNVQIVSWKANRLKSNASIEDLRTLCNYYNNQVL